MNGNNSKPGIFSFIKYGIGNFNTFRAAKKRDPVRTQLCLANMELGKLNYHDPVYMKRVEEFNQAMIEFYKGKWYATVASKTKSRDDWKKCFEGFKKAEKIGNQLYKHLRSSSTESIQYTPSKISSEDTEIKFADGVPLVPEITPVIILQGSDHEMGHQYAQQLVEIFGKWILERKTGNKFSESELKILKEWEKQHEKYTPWLLDFCHGWVEGANELGIEMSYEDVLDLWIGHKKPAEDFLDTGGLPEIPQLACSGVAAWGKATKDGKLVTGSTGDHDMSYQVTIVGYPEKGNNFIYSPFGATGDIAGAGSVYFFGHPAMNDKGLVYVHHGGGPKFLEPRKYWGYGIRRAASVMHVLRFCDNAREAEEMEKSWPIGDVGLGDQNTVGGFYADGEYAYIIEGRKEPEAIRNAGILGEEDFIYANNSTAHPRAIESEWMSQEKDEWMWDEHGGWRPKNPTGMTKSLSLFFYYFSGRLSTSDLLRKGMMFAYTNSCNRNRYLFDMMSKGFGKIDTQYMKMVYRNRGTIPEGPWKKISKDYEKTGKWGKISTGHASNAMTVVIKSDECLYYMCAGPAKRGLAPMMPSSNISIYGETNAFWELKLAGSPEKMIEYVKERAQTFIKDAKQELAKLNEHDTAYEPLNELIRQAGENFEKGEQKSNFSGKKSIYSLSKSVRAYTRAQVRAKQVLNALVPLPENLEDLMLF